MFGKAEKFLELFLGIKVSDSTIYRVCNRVGQHLPEQELVKPGQDLGKLQQQPKANGLWYDRRLDGQPEARWVETNLGRTIAFEAHIRRPSAHKPWPTRSMWPTEAPVRKLKAKFERLYPPDSLCKQIFVSDGATWISKWVSERYPKAIQILDYYHAVEHMAKAAEYAPDAKKWLKIQKKRLLENQLNLVIKDIEAIKSLPKEICRSLLKYLENNAYRMNYKHYRQQGWFIGSGAIESAHKTLIQARMKLSGQWWSNSGCDNILKLRVALMSNKGKLLKNVILRKAA
ncbi:UPF0236 family transposase-like protein [Runella slithyformis]|uniref:Transposase IS204/IS1001/IS1096/IS1165 DDE domain-containing protein n=1 Tax=Runella slithyformis (strain ATCC 29530 / DSM 19594 / LMG 11500 / NCIMB 11436 / LSU 4) TaxID=761193 RepID=A0A7U3ZQ78_RUNSL|nr:UPF0236 family protein [Runella slithyformis]AEI51365.1 hypothetical protein Runsl_5057 [Runella slithyformis DSM 19594]